MRQRFIPKRMTSTPHLHSRSAIRAMQRLFALTFASTVVSKPRIGWKMSKPRIGWKMDKWSLLGVAKVCSIVFPNRSHTHCHDEERTDVWATGSIICPKGRICGSPRLRVVKRFGGLCIGFWRPPSGMLRSYHPEHTGSHQNSEVKLDWAGLVLC
jgi:hypothetical protein